jgi:hypothetical protein
MRPDRIVLGSDDDEAGMRAREGQRAVRGLACRR